MKEKLLEQNSQQASEYTLSNEHFLNHGPSYVALKVLRFLEDSQELSKVLKNHQLSNIVKTILDDLTLSEIESIVWTLYIEKLFSFEALIDPYHFFLFTALKVKLLLTGNIDYLIGKILKSNPNFLKKFEFWVSDNEDPKVSIKEINSRFQEINEKIVYGVNYNYYVDSILAYSNAYDMGKAKKTKEKSKKKSVRIKEAKKISNKFTILPKVCKFSSDVPLLLTPHRSLTLSNKSSALSDRALESFLFIDDPKH